MPLVSMRPQTKTRLTAPSTIDKKRPKPIQPVGAAQVASTTGMGYTL